MTRPAKLAVLALLTPLTFGIVAWAAAVRSFDESSLGERELASALPPLWWLSLAVLLTGAVIISCSPRPHGWILAAYVAAIALVLYGTIPAIAEAPQYAWTYKHIGVVQLIEQQGATSPSVDVYNRWPGFFAAAAALSELMGLDNPVSYAAWSELLFALVGALLVAALAWSILRDPRITGLAAVLFTVGNWIGQGYFSPQATVFPLTLAVLLLTLRYFASGHLGDRPIHVAERLSRRRQRAAAVVRAAGAGASGRRTQVVALTMILALDAAIVATHQLTPYVLLLQVAALALVGVLRPRWILFAMTTVTIAYLLPNLRFVNDNYGLFTSLDPFANAHAEATTARPANQAWIYPHAGPILAVLFGAGAAISSLLLVRRGLARRALPLSALAAAPVLLLFGQGYGGEAALRIFLFSAPWGAMLMAWAIVLYGGPRARPLYALALCTVVVTLFMPAYFGQTQVNTIQRGEVEASEYFYEHAPDRAVLALAAPGFPMRVGARYAVMYGASRSEGSPSLLIEGKFAHRPLGPETVPSVARLLRAYSPHAYLAFSTTASRTAAVNALTPPGALGHLERALRNSNLFELWHAAPDARIYRLRTGLFELLPPLDG